MKEAGTNVSYEVKNNTLMIKVDLTQNHGPSKSGKTNIVASTGGFVALPNGASMALNVVQK